MFKQTARLPHVVLMVLVLLLSMVTAGSCQADEEAASPAIEAPEVMEGPAIEVPVIEIPADKAVTDEAASEEVAAEEKTADEAVTDETASIETEDLLIVSSDGTEHHFNVEIAATADSILQGLMFRESMPENHGMIFLFPKERERSFWMRNTLIPLDIIFINEDGSIRHIHENAIPLDETPLPSNGPVLTVLELNGGRVAELGIKPGDMVYLGRDGK